MIKVIPWRSFLLYTYRVHHLFSLWNKRRRTIRCRLVPLLFYLYIFYQLTSIHTVVCNFADDKAILTNNQDPILASPHLQDYLGHLETWFKLCGIKIDEFKSIYCTCSLQKGTYSPFFLNNLSLSSAQQVRYLPWCLDRSSTYLAATLKTNKIRLLDARLWLLRPTSKQLNSLKNSYFY